MTVGIALIFITQCPLGIGGHIGVIESATDDRSSKAGIDASLQREIIGNDRVSIYEEQPLALCLPSDEIAYPGATKMLFGMDDAASVCFTRIRMTTTRFDMDCAATHLMELLDAPEPIVHRLPGEIIHYPVKPIFTQ